VDYHPFTELNAGNLPWHILFGMQHSMVTMTMVAGRVLMKNRELVDLDEDKIFQNAFNKHKDVWEKYSQQ